MATLRAVKKRIKSAQNIKQITKAMKMVAAAKLRRAQDRIIAARPYAKKIEEVIADLIPRAEKKNYPILKENAGVKKEAMVLIAADKGLCGSFNMNIAKEAIKALKENQDISFFIIGKKGLDLLKRFNREIESFKFNDAKISWLDVEEVAGILLKNFAGEKYSRVRIVYSEFMTSLQQKIVRKNLLPVKFEPEKNEAGEEHLGREFLYEPAEAVVLSALLDRYMKTQLYRGILESQASEHGVRMVAMEMATNNAADMIDSLTLLANKTRQAAITKEILEIVGGAEALKG